MSSPISPGIAAVGLSLPPLAMDVATLATLRGDDPNKALVGLGCRRFAVAPLEVTAADLGAAAARRALARWGGDPAQIGMIAVGTETALDMSRPLSAYVAEQLGLRGAVRSYEVKHACYGGTLALRQAAEWVASGAARGKAALVIATDIARYTPGSGAEATQGAGAVAFIVSHDARIAAIDLHTHAWSAPAFDFWRPVGKPWPEVDGPLSLSCYQEAAVNTFRQRLDDDPDALDRAVAVCFHVPFPKMVKKAVLSLSATLGWDDAAGAAFWENKVQPTMGWNTETGNAYTASLWIAFCHALRGRAEGEELLAFSYGSGFGAELLRLVAGPEARDGAWAADIDADLSARTLLDGASYTALRAREG